MQTDIQTYNQTRACARARARAHVRACGRAGVRAGCRPSFLLRVSCVSLACLLRACRLQHNELCGDIPSGIAGMAKLKSLYLHFNQVLLASSVGRYYWQCRYY